MKGVEKLTSMRLAEVLTQKGIVPAETITDALYVQDKQGESFIDVMVDSGHVAEWDLAKVVVESFQLPFLLAGGYQLSDEVKQRIPEETLFRHLLVPLDIFDDVLTVSMPVLTTADVLHGLQTEHKVQIFPYVGLISENKKVLQDEFPNFKEWYKAFQAEKDRRAAAAKRSSSNDGQSEEDGGWTNLFDNADKAVLDSIKNQRS